MPMNDLELQSYLEACLADEAIETTFLTDNQELLERYYAELYGDEEEDASQVVTTDVQDLVESDMPALARIFLGQNNIMEFRPNNEKNEKDVREAQEKTEYINYLVREAGFKTIFDFLKDADMMKTGVVKYYYEETEEKESFEYENLTEEEFILLTEDFKDDDDVEWESENDEDGYHIKFTVTREKKRYVICGVPAEEFIITRNARSKDEAIVVGDRKITTRGELLAEGYSRDLVEQLPKLGFKRGDQLSRERNQQNGQSQYYNNNNPSGLDTYGHQWATEEVEWADLYILVDYDQDGIAERRHIIKSGDYVVENEPYKIPPYAMMSAIPMPHRAIGRSRAELAVPSQRQKTVLFRGLMDNIYAVNAGRVAVNEEYTNLDDLEVIKNTGYVRTTAENPAMAVAPLNIPYIGDKTLQVIQYVDTQRAQSTGIMLTNQGLDLDKFYKETATRFEGMQEAGDAKLELVARVFAETGFRELYEGLAWTVSHFQNEAVEIDILGKPLTVDPRRWRMEHAASSNVGLGIEDPEKMIANMGAVYQVQNEMKMNGSTMVDDVKIYNTMKKTLEGMGIYTVSDHFNNPEIEETQLQAMVEQMTMALQQSQQPNPLAEVEQIKQQSQIAQTQLKNQTESQQFVMKAIQDQQEFMRELQLKYTEIEARLIEAGIKANISKTVPNVPDSRI